MKPLLKNFNQNLFRLDLSSLFQLPTTCFVHSFHIEMEIDVKDKFHQQKEIHFPMFSSASNSTQIYENVGQNKQHVHLCNVRWKIRLEKFFSFLFGMITSNV